jgi:hypothetical protein
MLMLSRPTACSAVHLTPLAVAAIPPGARSARLEDVALENLEVETTADGMVTAFKAQLSTNGRWVQLHDWVVTAPDGTQRRYTAGEFLEHFTPIERAVNHLDTDHDAYLTWPPVIAALVDAVGVLRAGRTTDAAEALATADTALARAKEAGGGRGPTVSPTRSAHHTVTRLELGAAERAVLHAASMSGRMEALARYTALVVRMTGSQHDAELVIDAATDPAALKRVTVARSTRAMAERDVPLGSLARDIAELRRLADAADQKSDQRVYFHPGETDALRRVCDIAAVRPLHLTDAEHGPVIEDAVVRALAATPGVAAAFSAHRTVAAHAADAIVRDLNHALQVTPPTRVTPVTQPATVPAVVARA